MELLSPDFELLIWTLLAFLGLILMIIALVTLLRSNDNNLRSEFKWLVFILLVPIIGSVLYLANRKKQKEIA